MGRPGALWGALGCSGMPWDALGSETPWDGLRRPRAISLWEALGRSGALWEAGGLSGTPWGALGCSGTLWEALGGSGHPCPHSPYKVYLGLPWALRPRGAQALHESSTFQ